MKKRIIALLSCIIFTLSIIVISNNSDAGSTILNLTDSYYSVQEGKSFNLKVNGIKASKIKWSSANKSVATVSKNGSVKGIKAGNTTITGKYKKLKFKVYVTVSGKGNGIYTSKNMEVKFVESKVTKDYWEDNCWAIKFTFTNKSSSPECFGDNFVSEVYINDKQADQNSNDDAYTKIKNGKSIDVTLYYEVKSGDKLEFKLSTYDDNYNEIVVYETSETIK